MRSLCAVHKCKNQGKHLFPQDPILRSQWVSALRLDVDKRNNRQLKKYAYICSNHFKPTDFITTPKLFEGDQGTIRLRNKSIPSIFPWTAVVQNQALPRTPQEDINLNRHSLELPRKTYGKKEPPFAFVEEIPFLLSEPIVEKNPLQLDNENIEIEECNAGTEKKPLQVKEEHGIKEYYAEIEKTPLQVKEEHGIEENYAEIEKKTLKVKKEHGIKEYYVEIEKKTLEVKEEHGIEEYYAEIEEKILQVKEEYGIK